MMDDPDNLDQVTAALWLLMWQQPTDRALTGWCPDPYTVAIMSHEDTDDEDRISFWRGACWGD